MLDAPRSLRFEDHELPPIGRRSVRLRTLASGISHGTELSLYRGSSAFGDGVFDRGLRAFTRPGHARSAYPAPLGYELVAQVEEIGSGVTEFAPGDVIHAGVPHRDAAVLDLDAALRSTYPPVALPAGMPPEHALYISLAAVALVAIHDSGIALGDHVAVIGLGAIGLLLVQMARLAGAGRISVVDPVPARRALARELGADAALDPAAAGEGAGVALKRMGGPADVAVESSGATAGLQTAIAAVGLGGRVVTVGFYQGGAPELRLGEEWHHNRLEMVSSMGAWGAPHRAHPAWDRPRVMRTAVDLIADDRVQVAALPVRAFPFAEAIRAYEWLDDHPSDALKVALAYEGAQQPGGGKR
jgi:threonine dehydrogenase-like Zn-dependent dehydrogenase